CQNTPSMTAAPKPNTNVSHAIRRSVCRPSALGGATLLSGTISVISTGRQSPQHFPQSAGKPQRAQNNRHNRLGVPPAIQKVSDSHARRHTCNERKRQFQRQRRVARVLLHLLLGWAQTAFILICRHGCFRLTRSEEIIYREAAQPVIPNPAPFAGG